jgi:hypothetical protein
MVQNLVLNNSDFNFSSWADGLRREEDTVKVVASDGTDAAIVSSLRSELESGTLAGMGRGLIANFTA